MSIMLKEDLPEEDDSKEMITEAGKPAITYAGYKWTRMLANADKINWQSGVKIT